MTPIQERYQADRRQAAFNALQPMLGKPMSVAGADEDPAFLWERAYRDALKSLRFIPDPDKFAAALDERCRDGLRTAWRGRNGWRVQPEYLRELRLLSLVETGGIETDNAHERNHLTAFGIAVRRVVMEAF
jgi:hypothetical protein